MNTNFIKTFKVKKFTIVFLIETPFFNFDRSNAVLGHNFIVKIDISLLNQSIRLQTSFRVFFNMLTSE